jgi:hypothetical protein
MIRLVILVPTLILSILAQSCDFSLGNLDEFAINYKITVINGGDATAAIHIFLAGTTRDATVVPGDGIELVAFKGGVWHVNVVGAASRKTILQARSKTLTAQLDGLLAFRNPRAYAQLDNDLDAIDAAIEHSGQNSGGCSGEMKDPGGDVLSISVKNNTGFGPNSGSTTWVCTAG